MVLQAESAIQTSGHKRGLRAQPGADIEYVKSEQKLEQKTFSFSFSVSNTILPAKYLNIPAISRALSLSVQSISSVSLDWEQ